MNRIRFVATSHIAASAERVFNCHEAPGVFKRPTPSWEPGAGVREGCGTERPFRDRT